MVLERVSADDRLILWPDAVWPQDVGALAILDAGNLLRADGSFRIEAARDAVQHGCTCSRGSARFSTSPAAGSAGRCGWIAPPSTSATTSTSSLWPPLAMRPRCSRGSKCCAGAVSIAHGRCGEMWFLPGLVNRRVGLFVRWHHVVADGLAGVGAVGALLDAMPDAEAPDPHSWTPAARPSRCRLFIDNVRMRSGSGGRVPL